MTLSGPMFLKHIMRGPTPAEVRYALCESQPALPIETQTPQTPQTVQSTSQEPTKQEQSMQTESTAPYTPASSTSQQPAQSGLRKVSPKSRKLATIFKFCQPPPFPASKVVVQTRYAHLFTLSSLQCPCPWKLLA